MSSPSLRIAVLGVGNIGSTFAFQLARTGGHDVTVIARPGSTRLQQLGRDSGIQNVKGELANVSVSDMLDEQTAYDLVIVTLLDHQVAAVLPTLRRSAAKWIQFMFNSFDPERLAAEVGADRCSFGMPFVQATINKEGKLEATIGAAGQKSKMNHKGWVDVFVGAGLPAVFEEKMQLWLRCHVPVCVAFESVSIAGVRRGSGASWGEALAIARGLQESLTLIQRLGYRLYPSGKSLLHASPILSVAALLWSLSRITSFRQLLATGTGECRALVDKLVEVAEHSNQAASVPTIRAMRPS